MHLAWARTMHCPRCNSPLVERDRSRQWLPFFECQECFLAFEPVTERHRAPCGHNAGAWFIRTTTTLQPGRTRNFRPWSYRRIP